MKSLEDDVIRITIDAWGGIPHFLGHPGESMSRRHEFKEYVKYMSYDVQPWFAEKYRDDFSKSVDYVAAHVRTISAHVKFDAKEAATFDVDVALRVLGWEVDKTGDAFRDDVLQACKWTTDVFVASSSARAIDLFRSLCPENRIFHMPVNHKGVAGFSGKQFTDDDGERLSEREGVDDTMAEWTLLSRASRIFVYSGPSSFSVTAMMRGCGVPLKVLSDNAGRVGDFLRKMSYENPERIDHEAWSDVEAFRAATRDTPCDDVADSRACYARLASVYASPEDG